MILIGMLGLTTGDRFVTGDGGFAGTGGNGFVPGGGYRFSGSGNYTFAGTRDRGKVGIGGIGAGSGGFIGIGVIGFGLLGLERPRLSLPCLPLFQIVLPDLPFIIRSGVSINYIADTHPILVCQRTKTRICLGHCPTDPASIPEKPWYTELHSGHRNLPNAPSWPVSVGWLGRGNRLHVLVDSVDEAYGSLILGTLTSFARPPPSAEPTWEQGGSVLPEVHQKTTEQVIIL